LPTELETDERAIFLSKLKEGMMHEVVYASHPFDVVGWDGYNFPYGLAFIILNQQGAYINRHRSIKHLKHLLL
jgi:homogentisate 1,2-dioxygenase